ncbi:MAG: hypothetical protein WAN93_07785 [Solirubrobacteraceae bacterium]
MTWRHSKTKFLLLPVIALLGLGATACGSSKSTGSTSQAVSAVSTVSGTTTTTTSSSETSHPPQDDSHITTYGHEATEPDKREITQLVKSYYAAGLADDGAKACSLIYSPVAKSVPEDYGQSTTSSVLHGKTCAVVLSKVFRHLPEQSTADLATTKVTGVRLSGDNGYVQLSSKMIPTGEMVVQRQGHVWKVGVLIGRTCTGCAAK